VGQPDRPQAHSFREIAGKLAQQASIAGFTRQDLKQATTPQFKPEES